MFDGKRFGRYVGRGQITNGAARKTLNFILNTVMSLLRVLRAMKLSYWPHKDVFGGNKTMDLLF